jgi:hypothetical protein
MGYEANTGLGVSNHYGARVSGNAIGVETADGGVQVLKVQFTGASLNETFMPEVSVPKGALFTRYRLRVDEAFAVSAAGTVTFGGTVPGTNGVVLTETELENIGTKTPASAGAGTWATTSSTGTTAAELVTKSISGTVTATQGKATLFAEYVMVTKV